MSKPKTNQTTIEAAGRGQVVVAPDQEASILTALHGAGAQGLMMDDLNWLIPKCKAALDKLMDEGLVGHPAVTTKLWTLTPRGRAYMALKGGM